MAAMMTACAVSSCADPLAQIAESPMSVGRAASRVAHALLSALREQAGLLTGEPSRGLLSRGGPGAAGSDCEPPSHSPGDVVDPTVLLPDELPAASAGSSFNPTVDVDRAGILAEGADGSGEIALTFDDGPSAETTTEVLRILAAHRVRGAFFLTGRRLEGAGVAAEVNRGVARAIVAAGHVLGNHALDHLPLDRPVDPLDRPVDRTWGGDAWVEAQIDGATRLIVDATGVAPHWFRPPYGKIGLAARRILAARHDELVMWTIDAQDAVRGTDPDPAKLAHRLIGQITFAGQGVVLLHDLRPGTVRALALLLEWLDAHPRDPVKGGGYVVVDLPTYLAHAAAHPHPQSTRQELHRTRQRAHRPVRST